MNSRGKTSALMIKMLEKDPHLPAGGTESRRKGFGIEGLGGLDVSRRLRESKGESKACHEKELVGILATGLCDVFGFSNKEPGANA